MTRKEFELNVMGRMIRKYPEKKEYEQYRYESVVDFNCKKSKKSKLIVVYNEDWSKIICNGCYGTSIMK